MQIYIIAVGDRMPGWVNQACTDYLKRMPAHARVHLHQLRPRKRGKGADIRRILQDECARILAATPAGCRTIALERTGTQMDTERLAGLMRRWFADACDVALWIGGPEGLSDECIRRAQERWSLSSLTIAHPIVRVLLAEQLYRSWSIIAGRPYHR
jgi:23S rRNA (pseudouridine1915-N3)-methyltransferase